MRLLPIHPEKEFENKLNNPEFFPFSGFFSEPIGNHKKLKLVCYNLLETPCSYRHFILMQPVGNQSHPLLKRHCRRSYFDPPNLWKFVYFGNSSICRKIDYLMKFGRKMFLVPYCQNQLITYQCQDMAFQNDSFARSIWPLSLRNPTTKGFEDLRALRGFDATVIDSNFNFLQLTRIES